MPVVFHVGLVGTIAVASTGCGALSALTNPKAAWALDESAPMGVVMRRAEVANQTAKQVDRLLGKTGVNDASEWTPKTAMKKTDAEAMLGGIAKTDTYTSAKGVELRVVPAEAWVARFSSICSSESDHPSLLAAQSPELATAYDEISKISAKIAALETEKAEEEKAADDDKATEADKAAHEKKIDELEASIAKLEDSIDPKKDELIAKVREAASKSDEATKKRLSVVLVSLRRAVEDAKNDNSVVLLRYPMAMTSLPSDLQTTAKRVLADVVEEQTGKRPDLSSLNPEVKLDGMDVKLTVAGLSSTEIAGMAPDELIENTTQRLVAYAGRVVTLISYADETQTTLSFQADLLDAWMDGLHIDPSTVADAGDDISDLAIKTTAPPAKTADAANDDGMRTLGHYSPAGLRGSVCKTGKAEKVEVAATEEPADQKAKPAKPGKHAGSARPSKPAQASVAQQKPSQRTPGGGGGGTILPASTLPAAAAASEPKQCDIVVTNAEGTFCM